MDDATQFISYNSFLGLLLVNGTNSQKLKIEAKKLQGLTLHLQVSYKKNIMNSKGKCIMHV